MPSGEIEETFTWAVVSLEVRFLQALQTPSVLCDSQVQLLVLQCAVIIDFFRGSRKIVTEDTNADYDDCNERPKRCVALGNRSARADKIASSTRAK